MVDGADHESDEQALDLVARERYEISGCRLTVVFVCAYDREEGVREHGQGDPPRPGGIAADLVLIQARQALSGLEELLHSHRAPATRTKVVSGTGMGE